MNRKKLKDDIARARIVQHLESGMSVSKTRKETGLSYALVKMVALQEGFLKEKES